MRNSFKTEIKVIHRSEELVSTLYYKRDPVQVDKNWRLYFCAPRNPVGLSPTEDIYSLDWFEEGSLDRLSTLQELSKKKRCILVMKGNNETKVILLFSMKDYNRIYFHRFNRLHGIASEAIIKQIVYSLIVPFSLEF